ncbi:poly-beta-1,6-N-acetyl-D-glucosamine N-deacetylase PgaB [Xenophilus arseniciresistens]|uniref:Poly-beta-1,6-N-acetyl-D-glucosamine N-deacetylase PgaB n=1 Tax=Xenophilus arseniciresistens TaxID=1283306 RepID=A0AAE3NBQ6_9BURK|nr:poly-beta-1,6-N-acetyl-D-glucosamine N-deacetylase PgaB [Xenophilus arseniciresistens]MDA7418448.1 poly-beta-1,6-N-acetyl-D-glucosamine N-deacetylase PgaB [Xenophilus arseniciresistens]
MTRRRALAFSALLGAGSAWPLQAAAQVLPPPDAEDGSSFRVLAFHDIRDDVRADFEAGVDGTAINESTLVDFFAWLVQHRYNVVSLQQVIAARTGGAPLPPRAVLLSFDDGYRSTYTRVFPLLRQHGFSAVLALVSSWMEVPSGARVPYGSHMLPREQFLSWDQAAEMARSGLVELASHSHALHEGIQGNPQGNLLAAATTLRFDPASQRYEDVDTHVRRVEADLRRSRELIEARTGARVRAIAWPYGAYHSAAVAAAARAGMPVTLTLDDGPNTPAQPLSAIRRALPSYLLSAPEFQWLLRQSAQGQPRPINRIMHVDLDYVYDPDPAQQELNLSLLIERVAAVAPRAVFLQAFADPDGDGVAEALYFPNRHLPVRADLFSRAAWQIYTRAGARVYAWMPVMSFRLPEGHPLAARVVQAQDPSLARGRYQRLSPFDEEVRTLIGDIYEDLGRHARFQGLLFHDDAFLGEDEDTSPAALQTYARWQLPADVARIRSEPALMQHWTAAKTRHLTEFTHMLAQRTRAWQPVLETARNYYARTVMEPQSQAWFAQDYAAALDAYDYVALMAMPYMEEAADAKQWLAQLAQRVAATPGGAQRTLFELQARDWRSNRPLADAELAEQWELLLRHGMRHLGYYPDDFHNNQPSQALLQRMLSVRSELARPQVWARDPAARGAQ